MACLVRPAVICRFVCWLEDWQQWRMRRGFACRRRVTALHTPARLHGKRAGVARSEITHV